MIKIFLNQFKCKDKTQIKVTVLGSIEIKIWLPELPNANQNLRVNHIPICENHLKIDIIFEDCDEFICSQGAKTDHKDPDWNTILTAGSLRSRELKKPLGTVMEGDAKKRDEGKKVIKQMEKI